MIFVTGCARSGTSLVTGILRDFGVHLGDVNSLNENTGVREGVLKPYLRALGADPMGQNPLPGSEGLPPQHYLREVVLERIGGHEPRAYKDAKLTLVWPVWHAAFRGAKWVLVRRDAEAIAESCLRTPFMTAFKTREGWLEWVSQHEARFEAMRERLNIIEVWPARFIREPVEFEPVCAFLGLPFDKDVVENAIDRSRWH